MAGMFARILPASKGIRLPLRENGDRTACAKDGGLELSRSCGLRKSYSSELFESGQWYLAQSLRKKNSENFTPWQAARSSAVPVLKINCCEYA
jgi:hypothetical protein